MLKRKQKKIIKEVEKAKENLRKYVDTNYETGMKGKTHVLREFDKKIVEKAKKRVDTAYGSNTNELLT